MTPYNKLKNEIGSIIENMNILPIKPNTKKPACKWEKEDYPSTNLSKFKYNSNLAVIMRDTDKFKLSCIDLDGFKKHEKNPEAFYLPYELNKAFKTEIIKMFTKSEIAEYCLIQQTQSGGYHILFNHKDNTKITNKFFNSFKIPPKLKNNYDIPFDYLGDGAKSGAIEIFHNVGGNGKYIILYPSKINGNPYKIIKKGKKFGEPIPNVKNTLIKIMEDNGFKYKKETNKKKEQKKTTKNNKKLNEAEEKEDNKKTILKDEELFNLFVEEFKSNTGHHNELLGHLTGILLNLGLNKKQTEDYLVKMLKIAGDYTKEHHDQIKSRIKSNDGTIINYKKHLNNSDLIQKIDNININIKNNIKDFIKGDTKKIDLAEKLKSEFKIKKTAKPEVKTYYLNNKGYYEVLKPIDLSLLIKNNFNIIVPEKKTKALIENMLDDTKINNNYIIFKNGLLNRLTGELEPTDLLNKYIVLDKAGIDTEDGFQLFNYIKETKTQNKNPTLIEKTLKEVLIPKYDLEDDRLYIDRLQRYGANILKRKRKSIAYYYSISHNTGKSMLRSIGNLISDSAVINPDELDKDHMYNVFGNKTNILIDETQKGQLEKHKDKIKKFSSPDSSEDSRGIYTDEKIKTEYGNLEIFTNYLIKLGIDEIALFYRMDILQPPNKFIDNKEDLKKHNNAYLVNSDLIESKELLKKDCKGLEWLTSVCINEYLKMEKDNLDYKCRQTTSQTRNFILKVDNLTEFIGVYTVPNEDNLISNKEILANYLNYLELKGLSNELSKEKLQKEIGIKIKELYGSEVKTRDAKGVKYRLKIKELEEVEREFKQVYITNEDNLTEKQVELLSKLTPDQKVVFAGIKNGEYNTINKLNKKYRNINVIEIVRTLERLNLIKNTFNYQIE